jgi:hypothetical protein
LQASVLVLDVIEKMLILMGKKSDICYQAGYIIARRQHGKDLR